MTQDIPDTVEFDELILLALAELIDAGEPRPDVKQRLMAGLGEAVPPLPRGFAISRRADNAWVLHPVPGIRMRVLALNRESGYATLLLDVAPGTRFPAHHHSGAEECYVISGSLFSCGRRFAAGDFLHADADTEHGELFTEEGTQVLLVVPPEDYMPAPAR